MKIITELLKARTGNDKRMTEKANKRKEIRGNVESGDNNNVSEPSAILKK